ncbi:MAG TPA: FGGY family carbohydrate kinase [Anaerolineales bacterium]|nr:FGGY family carbohydrate kinase [Anaerolineales bacterium]
MASRYILTVDVGTSSTKTSLWTETGQLVAHTTSPYDLRRSEPLWAEIDGDTWWQAVCKTIQSVLAQSEVDLTAVAGIGIDGVGWTLVPVDRAGNPLYPAMIWLDRRAEQETNWLKSLPEADALVNLDANPLDAAYITPKLVWLKKNQPEIFNSAYKFLDATGFIVSRFTGTFVCDYTQAYGYHFFDMRNQEWDQQAAQGIGIPIEKMPQLCGSTEIAGSVTERAAAQTGLKPGIPVIAGCLDAAAGALGSGVIKPGQTNEQGGQAGGVGISLDHVLVEPRLIFSHHVIPGQYLLQAGTVGGGSLSWFRDQLGHPEVSAGELIGQNPFELFSRQAERSRPGANGLIFLPYMAGERTPLWSSIARGVFFGLSYNTKRADILRAIMEGCAFAVYDNLQIAAEHGVLVDEFLGSGGAIQSAVWCQIKADIYGKPFIVARRADGGEGGHGLGLFALTTYGVGLRPDIGTCVSDLLPARQVFEPSTGNHALYQELFAVYRSLSRKLMDDFARLDTITRNDLK